MGHLSNISKTAALSIPYTREKYFQHVFLNRPPSCKGNYKSFAEAAANSPREKLSGYDHPEVADFHRSTIDDFNPGDYPVLFWLSQILPRARLVFELGGSIGRGYYAYRRYLAFPPELRWLICETSETVQVGREIAEQRGDRQLAFTTDRENPEEPDLYATFGALQYIEEPFAEIIDKLAARPPHLLLNRVALTEGDSFITLQNNGGWFSPYKVANKADFIQGLIALGYELVDQWKVARDNQFLGQPQHSTPYYAGMYFRLRKSAAA